MDARNLGFHANSTFRPSSMHGPRFSAQTYGSDRVAPGVPSVSQTLTTDSTLSRRCEFLEKQGKQMTETANQDRKKLQTDLTTTTKAIYEEMQWVYGKTNVKTTLGRRTLTGNDDILVASKRDTKLLLVYPMRARKIDQDDGSTKTEYLMRCKMVDPDTAQLSICWIVVQDSLQSSSGELLSCNKHIHSYTFA